MITYYGINNRDHILNFQNELLKKNVTKDSKYDNVLSTEKLGRNLSGFICEKNNFKLLVLLDADDGSGGTTSDCKIVWSTLNDIYQKYNPHDLLILKSQINSDPEYNQFYPFKIDVYPLGIFSNDTKKILKVKNTLQKTKKDIDVFFAGGHKHKHCRPYAWSKERDIKKWWVGAQFRGYSKILEIKNKRPDLNIQLFDNTLSADQFYDYVNRSKICLDLPGVGLSSRKFYEFLVLEKTILSLKQQLTPWECDENIHYCSMGMDLDFNCMEEKIDLLLSDDNNRLYIENNVKKIQSQLSIEFMISRVENIIFNKLNSITHCVLHY